MIASPDLARRPRSASARRSTTRSRCTSPTSTRCPRASPGCPRSACPARRSLTAGASAPLPVGLQLIAPGARGGAALSPSPTPGSTISPARGLRARPGRMTRRVRRLAPRRRSAAAARGGPVALFEAAAIALLLPLSGTSRAQQRLARALRRAPRARTARSSRRHSRQGSDEARGIVAIATIPGGPTLTVGWLKVTPASGMQKAYDRRLYRKLPCFEGIAPAFSWSDAPWSTRTTDAAASRPRSSPGRCISPRGGARAPSRPYRDGRRRP